MKNSSTAARLGARIFIFSLLVVALSSCSTQHLVKPGHALIEIDRSGESQARIRHPMFVSVNGKALSSAQRRVQLSEGSQEVTIRFAFTGEDDQEAKLRFKARANRCYSVSFDPFPESSPMKAGEKKWIPSGAFFVDVVTLPFKVGKSIGEKGVHSMENHTRNVQWADIRVISDDLSEGIVEDVRVP